MLSTFKKAIVITTLSFSLSSFTFAQRSEVVIPKINEKISRASFLRGKLPENAVFYIRLPSQFGMAFNQKNRASDIIIGSSVNEKVVLQLKKLLQDPKVVNDALKDYLIIPNDLQQMDLGVLTTFLYAVIDGPIEAIGIDPNKSTSPLTQILISIPVTLKSTKEIESTVSTIMKQNLPLSFTNNFLQIDKTASLYFDDKDQRLYLSTGMSALTEDQLKSTVASLKRTEEHKMYAYENQIDLTGQNFFAWIDVIGSRNLIAMLSQQKSPIMAEYIMNTEGVAYGIGTNSGKLGQAKFVSKTNTDKIPWLHSNATAQDFKTLGEPENVIILSIPTKESLLTVLSADPDALANVTAASQKIALEIGFDPLNILDIFGPQIIGYQDTTGSNIALSIRDYKAFDERLENLKKNKDVSYQKSKGVHELKIKNPLHALFAQGAKANTLDKLMTQYSTIQPWSAEFVSALYGIRALDAYVYLYWSDEKDWIIINSLPYSLVERQKATHSLAKWFNQQDIQLKDVVVGFDVTLKDAEEKWYRDYLKFLRNNHDLLGQHFDLFSMPAPSSVKFNPTSRLGFHVSKNSEWVVVSLDYDISPFYAFSLFGGESSSVSMVAITGIMSAFALPAYQDYTKRAYVAEGMALAAAAKLASTEMYATEGKWPSNNQEARLSPANLITGQGVSSIKILPGAEIEINYNSKVQVDGFIKIKGQLKSNPGSVYWECIETNLNMKILPVNCRTQILSPQ